MCQCAVFVLTVRVYDGQRVGKCLAAEMVIQNDDICTRGRLDCGMRQRSAIDTDNQVMRAGERCHCFRIWAIALVDPVWNIEGRLYPEMPEPVREQGR